MAEKYMRGKKKQKLEMQASERRKKVRDLST